MEGWITHTGTQRPVGPDEWVEIANAAGETLRGIAGRIEWGEIDPEGRVVRYRRIEPAYELLGMTA